MAFNREAAKKAGYSDAEIDKYLSKQKVSGKKILGGAIPTLGAILGGIGGGFVGNVPGAIGGAAIGAGGGSALENSLSDLLGRQTETPGQQLVGAGKNIGKAGLNEILGIGLAKGLGLATHPLTPFINKVATLLEKSGSKIDLGQILGELKQVGEKQFAKGVASSEFPKAYSTVASDISSAIPQLGEHLAADTALQPGVDVASQNVPVKLADIIKKGLQRGASNYYGEGNVPALEQTRKIAAALIRQAEEKAVPGIKTPNAIAHAGYSLGDVLPNLSYALPWKTGLLFRRAGSTLAKGVDKAIPYGGGYLNNVLSTLTQLLNPPKNSQTQ